MHSNGVSLTGNARLGAGRLLQPFVPGGEPVCMKEILRWKCSICRMEITVRLNEGSVCANCYEPACNRHLSAHKVKGRIHYICAKCVKGSPDM